MKLAVIPGDGIGIEVTEQALRVLDSVVPNVAAEHYDLGAARWHRTGEVLPDSVLEEIRGADAILLGAVGDPSVPPGVLERGLLLRLRFELDHHVNLRPAKLYPGVTSPLAGDPTIDFVVIREGTEGPYTGNGGTLRKGTAHEVATEVSVNTAFGVERVVRDAFTRAQARPRKHLTLVHKNNVLTYAGDLWFRTVTRLGEEFPDVTVAYNHVDASHLDAADRRHDLSRHRPQPLRRDRHRQPVRRHHHRPRCGDRRRHRARGEREPRRQPHEPVDVRAGPWLGAGHRRPGQSRSDRGSVVGVDAARARRRSRGGRTC